MKKKKCFVENSFYVLVDNSFFNSSFFKLKKYVLFKLEKKNSLICKIIYLVKETINRFERTTDNTNSIFSINFQFTFILK